MCSGGGQIVCKLLQALSSRGFVVVVAASGIAGDRGASGNDPIGKLAAALGLLLLEVQFALPW